MMTSIQARFSAVIVGVIVVLVVALSGVLYVHHDGIMRDIRDSNVRMMETALLDQARIQAVNQVRYLADTLANDLDQARIDRLKDIASVAKMQQGVVYILVCDDQSRIVTDGTASLPAFTTESPIALSEAALRMADGQALIEDGTLHVTQAIFFENLVVGSVKMGFSLAAIRDTIGSTKDAFDAISEGVRRDYVFATFIGIVVLVMLGILLSILVSRWLTTPIEADFHLRKADLEHANEALTGEIAERQRVEARFIRLQSDLAHVGRLGTVGELAGGLAHELNQPLSTISSYASGGLARLRSGTVKPTEMSEAFERIVEQVGRAGEIIRWIREFVRKGPPRRDRVDVNAVVHEAVAVLGMEPKRLGVEVVMDLAEGLPDVHADKIQIQQAVLNLVGNALDSFRLGNIPGRIVVRSIMSGKGYIQVDVEDNGPGLAPEIRDMAFDPFFTTKPSGLGLGLSLCRSIIDTHGGQLWVTSPGMRGAIFHFTLPVGELSGRHHES